LIGKINFMKKKFQKSIAEDFINKLHVKSINFESHEHVSQLKHLNQNVKNLN
jgi:hypothetical protein